MVETPEQNQGKELVNLYFSFSCEVDNMVCSPDREGLYRKCLIGGQPLKRDKIANLSFSISLLSFLFSVICFVSRRY